PGPPQNRRFCGVIIRGPRKIADFVGWSSRASHSWGESPRPAAGMNPAPRGSPPCRREGQDQAALRPALPGRPAARPALRRRLGREASEQPDSCVELDADDAVGHQRLELRREGAVVPGPAVDAPAPIDLTPFGAGAPAMRARGSDRKADAAARAAGLEP